MTAISHIDLCSLLLRGISEAIRTQIIPSEDWLVYSSQVPGGSSGKDINLSAGLTVRHAHFSGLQIQSGSAWYEVPSNMRPVLNVVM